jgi:hypothetical protein
MEMILILPYVRTEGEIAEKPRFCEIPHFPPWAYLNRRTMLQPHTDVRKSRQWRGEIACVNNGNVLIVPCMQTEAETAEKPRLHEIPLLPPRASPHQPMRFCHIIHDLPWAVSII